MFGWGKAAKQNLQRKKDLLDGLKDEINPAIAAGGLSYKYTTIPGANLVNQKNIYLAREIEPLLTELTNFWRQKKKKQ